jgi:hypothetical protein
MATKKKTKKNPTKSNRPVAKKATPKRRPEKKRRPSRKSARKKPASRKAIAKKKTIGQKQTGSKVVGTVKKKAVPEQRGAGSSAFLREPPRSHSGEQSGDLQGLSRRERVGSESVDELMEEGNAFEAEVVQGVEDAGDDEGREVRTHEVSEDDIPEEYLDRDKE